MLLGGLLFFSPCIGFLVAMNHSRAFLNVTLASNPGVTSSTNNIMLCTTILGIAGLLLLTLSIILFVRTARSPGPTHSHPGDS